MTATNVALFLAAKEEWDNFIRQRMFDAAFILGRPAPTSVDFERLGLSYDTFGASCDRSRPS